MQRDRLQDQLIRDEGLRLKPYTDTVGKLTIGVGRNLTDRGITQTEAFYLLDRDIDLADLDCRARLPWFDTLDEVRQAALVNMCFNLGINRLMKFKHTLECIKHGDYEQASVAMLESLWAQQTGDRSLRLAEQIRTGKWV